MSQLETFRGLRHREMIDVKKDPPQLAPDVWARCSDRLSLQCDAGTGRIVLIGLDGVRLNTTDELTAVRWTELHELHPFSSQ
jgi:hypothetical protein